MAKTHIKIGSSGNSNCPFEVRWREFGELKRKRFAKKGDADLFFSTLTEDSQTPDFLQFPPSERLLFLQLKEICAEYNLPIKTLLDIVKSNIQFYTSDGKDWNFATQEYFADLEKRKARPASIKSAKQKLSFFYKHERPENIAEITQERAEKYFASINSPEHSKRVLRAFFNFCISKKWISQNPFASAQVPKSLSDKKPISILSIDETKNLLVLIPPPWKPTFALMAFCGVRPNEIIPIDKPVMRIEDIDFENKKINVMAEIAKTRTMRLFTPPDNIWAWIEPLKKRNANENVAPGSYDAFKGVKKRLGIKLEKDVLRHSFGSYGYHYFGAEQTVEIMGHVGDLKVFFKHYKGLSDKKSATEYFSIAP